MRRRPVVSILLAALLAAGCGAAEAPKTRGRSASELLYVRDGDGSALDTVRAIDVRTGRDAMRRPLGVTAEIDGRAVTFSARTDGTGTRVEARDAATGALRAQRTLPGAWALPEPARDGTIEGVAADGRTLVLVAGSRFAILDTSLGAPARVVNLGARFSYDALSPDGSVLYVVEHLSDPRNPGRYQVRAFDLAGGRIRPGFIADKRELDEPMAGYPLARASSPDGGWVYTLWEVDRDAALPAAPHSGDDGEAGTVHAPRVALAADGRTLYAIGPRGLSAIDTLSLRPRDRLLADRRLAGIAISPDARRLYAVDAATRAVLALDARTGRRLGAVDGATGAVSLLGVVRAAK